MKKGVIYRWEIGCPSYLNDPKNRYYLVLSVTLTHVYVRNVRLGSSFNFPIDTFEKEFIEVHRPQQKHSL